MEAKQVIVFAVVLLLLDLVWLIGAKKHHEKTVMDIQRSPLVLDKTAAIAFYILAGLVYASIITKLQKTGMSPFKSGAMLGAAMYFTFDFTNKAIFKDYRWTYAIADGLWGTFAVGLAAHITSKLVKIN